nr:hypothetical protein [Martelella mediterranea]
MGETDAASRRTSARSSIARLLSRARSAGACPSCAPQSRLARQVGTSKRNPYPYARSIIVSNTLNLPADAEVEIRRTIDGDWLDALRRSAENPIYLCGGGLLASAIANIGEIQVLRLKRTPSSLEMGHHCSQL